VVDVAALQFVGPSALVQDLPTNLYILFLNNFRLHPLLPLTPPTHLTLEIKPTLANLEVPFHETTRSLPHHDYLTSLPYQ